MKEKHIALNTQLVVFVLVLFALVCLGAISAAEEAWNKIQADIQKNLY